MDEVRCSIATTNENYEDLIRLFKAYFEELGLDLDFQNPHKDMEEAQIMYGQPDGLAVLAFIADEPVGCVALRLWDNKEIKIGEVKRMYILPLARRRGISYKLMDILIDAAYEMKYEILKLDTLQSMHGAIKVYKEYGFYETDPYYYNPLADVVYFEKVMNP
ncbi:MAG: hypothetical protein RLZZ546_3152 [Bacteroidota bacterium]|jgi:GNAT superfamily N-acetyltransferase